MPKAKNTSPKKEDKCCGGKISHDIHKLGDELSGLIKKAKDKYDNADDKTKKAVIAGIAGATALIAGAISYKKHKKK